MKILLLIISMTILTAGPAFAKKGDGGNVRGCYIDPLGTAVKGDGGNMRGDGGNKRGDGGNVACPQGPNNPIFDPNGSWPNARKLLLILKEDLGDSISFMNQAVLTQIIRSTPPENPDNAKQQAKLHQLIKTRPWEVTKEFLANVIRTIKIPSNQELNVMKPQPGIRPFYYDLDTQTIKAQYSYFLMYGLYTVESTPDGEKRAIDEYMLREASHLWGFGSDQSEYFAKALADALRISPYKGELGITRLKPATFSGRTECDYVSDHLNSVSTKTIVFETKCVDTNTVWQGSPVFAVTGTLRIKGCDENNPDRIAAREKIIDSEGQRWNDQTVIYSKYSPVGSQEEGQFLIGVVSHLLPSSQTVKASLDGQMDFTTHSRFSGGGTTIDGVRARIGGNFCDISMEDN